MSSGFDSASLLVLEDARIDGANGPLFDGVSFRLSGTRVGLLGAFSALFRLMSRSFTLRSGRALVLGHPADEAVFRGVLGVSLADTALPNGWSVREFLHTSAVLQGLEPARARRVPDELLQPLGLSGLRERAIGSLTRAERRALLIAHACLGDPALIALDRPFADLDESSAPGIAELIARAARGRALLLSSSGVGATGAERGTFDGLDAVAVLGAGGRVRVGRPDELVAGGRTISVGVTQRATELEARLTERGCRVSLLDREPGLPETTAHVGAHGAARLQIELGPTMTPDDLISEALEIGAPLVELAPWAGEADASG